MENILAKLTALNWIELIVLGTPIVISIATALEKTFKVDIIGLRICRLVWRFIKFLFNWLMMPFKPQLDALKKIWFEGRELENKFLEYLEAEKLKDEAIAEEKTQDRARFLQMEETLNTIKKEVTFNSGSSMKDAVAKTLAHMQNIDSTVSNLDTQVKLVSLRLDIADEAAGRMSFFLDVTQKCTAISANYLRHFAYAEKDMLGANWDFCFHKKSRTAVRKVWKEAFKKQTTYRNDQIIVASNGEEYKCLVCGYPQFDSDGHFTGFYGTVEILEEEDE